MTKLRLSMFLLVCILGTSFIPCYADNNVSNNTKSETSLNQDASSLSAPRRKKSKRRGRGRRGGSDLAFEQGKVAIDLGAGYPMLATGYKMKLPPLFVSGEYGVWSGTSWALGLGVYGGYYASTFDPFASLSGFGGSTAPDVKYDYSYLLIGAKGTLHYNFSSKFEIYSSIIIGYNDVSMKMTGKDVTSDMTTMPGVSLAVSGVFPSAVVGLKFYFTDNIGIFLEGGYGVTLVGGGLSLKF